MSNGGKHLENALKILAALGLPGAQQNERSALCLLAILDLKPNKTWPEAANPRIGITPIMDWARVHYGKDYKPNTRESVRRQTMHQFRDAGIVVYNPDDLKRAVNSPKTVYQVEPDMLALLRTFGTKAWDGNLKVYLEKNKGLAARYAQEREARRIPVEITPGKQIRLSPGEHNELIRQIIESFVPRFAPGSLLIYVGDTGDKWGYFDEGLLASLGVKVDAHGKMPDVVVFYKERGWLLLIESVTSHGPVDGKRRDELAKLFKGAKAGLVYVTAFPNRNVMARYLPEVAWETEVWVADNPTHMVHFNGDKFLGPYATNKPGRSQEGIFRLFRKWFS